MTATMVLKNGDRLTEAIGSPSDLKGWEQPAEKFAASAAVRLPREQLQTVRESIPRLPEIASIRTLTAALRSNDFQ